MNNPSNKNRGVQRRDGHDLNQIGSSVDLTSEFPLALAMGLAPAALAVSGIGFGIAELIQARRHQQKLASDAAWEASQTCIITTNSQGDPQPEMKVESKPQAPKLRTPYDNVFAFPTLRPRW